VEPVVGNMGCVIPDEGFLVGLRELCDENGAILIFDEVMTGFRLAPGGAQERFGIVPDLCTMGKVIGGGLPVGAYGGRKDIMKIVSPSGPMYQAGTLSGNPLAMAAGIAQLTHLKDHPEVYDQLEKNGAALGDAITAHARKKGHAVQYQRVGSMATLFFSPTPIRNWDDAAKADTKKFAKYFWALMKRGIYMPCSQYEAAFLSAAHSEQDIERTVKAICEAMDEVG
jgi:glutamate-1-semialdehyde 2,1-aminomutase